MMDLNEIIHQPVRLRMMAALVALPPSDTLNFVDLRNLLGVTDGNLGAHIQKLEDAGYIMTEKTYVARKPCTFVGATTKGRAAFDEYVASLKAILPDGV